MLIFLMLTKGVLLQNHILFISIKVKTERPDLEQASGAWRCACWRVNRIHPCELLSKVSNIKFAFQLWLEWSLHLLLCQVRPVQSLLGDGMQMKDTWILE